MPVCHLLFAKQVQFLRGGWISRARQALPWTVVRPGRVEPGDSMEGRFAVAAARLTRYNGDWQVKAGLIS